MTLRTPSLSRLLRGLLGLLVLALPLQAQLDPRLQVGNTDFLDLYQQSSNAKVKPEVITIFDFSGSMEALMYHPLFPNTTSTTAANGGSIDFTLDPFAGVGANTYTIKVTSKENNAVYATVDVTVGGSMSNPYNSGEQREQQGSGSSRKYLYTSITNITAVGNPGIFNPGTAYTFQATVSLRATDRYGTRSPWLPGGRPTPESTGRSVDRRSRPSRPPAYGPPQP